MKLEFNSSNKAEVKALAFLMVDLFNSIEQKGFQNTPIHILKITEKQIVSQEPTIRPKHWTGATIWWGK